MERQLVWINPLKNLLLKSQEQEHSTLDKFHQVNSEDSTIEVTYLLLLSMDLKIKFIGKSKSNNLITIITYLFSLKVSEKSKIHTDSWLSKEFSTCLRKVVLKSYQSFLNWSFPLKVSPPYLTHLLPNILFFYIKTIIILIFFKFSRFEYKRHGNYLNLFEDLIGTRYMLWHHWWGSRSLLQIDLTSYELIQDQELKPWR